MKSLNAPSSRIRDPIAFAGVAVIASVISGCATTSEPDLAIAGDIEARRAQFTPTEVTASLDTLSAGDRKALDHLIEAARHIDSIFSRQAWRGNPDMAPRVAALTGPGAEAAKDYYRIHYGPWDRLEDFEPFLGSRPHPQGAGYYPEDMTKEEFESWLGKHPEDREAFRSLYTVIRRDGDRLVAVPYSVAYRDELDAAAREMRAAAEVTTDSTLARFLRLRADAFFTDDYYDSDLAWMDLAGDLEVVIGPYETYEDLLFGYKAAFEAFLCILQPEDSRALEKYKAELPFLERSLPIPDEHKNLERGTESPIRVADEICTAGDTRAGVQTLAFNLPNDERVRETKGSKKVLLKNVMRAKYQGILLPIAGKVLPPGDASRIDFDAYFHFILFHELVHGIGPGRITLDGRETEVRLELKELYSAFEEAKADVVGQFALHALAARGIVSAEISEALPWTVVAGFFRTARFGTSSAHGQGVVMQVNYLLEKGAVEITAEGSFRPVLPKWDGAIRDLARDLLLIQALGDYEGAREFVERYGKLGPGMAAAIDSLEGIPVDVDPVYESDFRRRAP